MLSPASASSVPVSTPRKCACNCRAAVVCATSSRQVSPLLGTLGDRLGLRRVLASMRFAYAALSGVILLLAATGQLSPWAVLAVAGVAGMLRPSDIGMRTALVSATVPPQHLMAAMGISRTSMDSAKIGRAHV